MRGKWATAALVLGVATTLLNLAILLAQLSSTATARGGNTASQLLDDDDFTDGLTRIIRKTVRNYCTVGKRNGIDC